jgi:hypothetical protein
LIGAVLERRGRDNAFNDMKKLHFMPPKDTTHAIQNVLIIKG